MSIVKDAIENGNYHISNVENGNYATLKNANQGTPITASKDVHSMNIKWTITKLSSEKYTIRSFVYLNYAKVSAAPSKDEVAVGRSDEYQWDIKKTGNVGEFLIYPVVDNSLYWGFATEEAGTDVKLTTNGDRKARWNFEKVTV